MKKLWLIVLGVLCVVVISLGYVFSSEEKIQDAPAPLTKMVDIGGELFKLDVVADRAGRTQGLSGREGLATGTGMLFVFPVEGTYGFWMKDMFFSIDIIWLSSDGYITHIVEAATPESYPKTFTPDGVALYVIEVPAHTIERNNVKVGDFVDIGM